MEKKQNYSTDFSTERYTMKLFFVDGNIKRFYGEYTAKYLNQFGASFTPLQALVHKAKELRRNVFRLIIYDNHAEIPTQPDWYRGSNWTEDCQKLLEIAYNHVKRNVLPPEFTSPERVTN